ncbi:hypothetical protein SSBG_02378 [Streptomyces sp. SPB074]|nr:hypothetical protein SSBG_02378 [Streptomyces sp. SPB074]
MRRADATPTDPANVPRQAPASAPPTGHGSRTAHGPCAVTAVRAPEIGPARTSRPPRPRSTAAHRPAPPRKEPPKGSGRDAPAPVPEPFGARARRPAVPREVPQRRATPSSRAARATASVSAGATRASKGEGMT